MAPEPFGARLHAAVARRGALCVGIDPHPHLLAGWGLGDDPAGLERFASTVVEALAPRVAVLKPQAAFFERHGARGMAVLERTIAQARSAGALVLVDAKRGDIGSTVEAYAQAYLDPASPLAGDAVTAAPYLGVGALRPMIEAAGRYGTGVFVLALTSNPDGAAVQRARTADGRVVAQLVVDEVAAVNRGATPLGSIGVVIGATVGDLGLDLAALHGPVLVPGVGAQGGTAGDVRRLFGAAPPLLLPAISRQILQHGPDPDRLRGAASAALADLAAAV